MLPRLVVGCQSAQVTVRLPRDEYEAIELFHKQDRLPYYEKDPDAERLFQHKVESSNAKDEGRFLFDGVSSDGEACRVVCDYHKDSETVEAPVPVKYWDLDSGKQYAWLYPSKWFSKPDKEWEKWIKTYLALFLDMIQYHYGHSVQGVFAEMTDHHCLKIIQCDREKREEEMLTRTESMRTFYSLPVHWEEFTKQYPGARRVSPYLQYYQSFKSESSNWLSSCKGETRALSDYMKSGHMESILHDLNYSHAIDDTYKHSLQRWAHQGGVKQLIEELGQKFPNVHTAMVDVSTGTVFLQVAAYEHTPLDASKRSLTQVYHDYFETNCVFETPSLVVFNALPPRFLSSDNYGFQWRDVNPNLGTRILVDPDGLNLTMSLSCFFDKEGQLIRRQDQEIDAVYALSCAHGTPDLVGKVVYNIREYQEYSRSSKYYVDREVGTIVASSVETGHDHVDACLIKFFPGTETSKWKGIDCVDPTISSETVRWMFLEDLSDSTQLSDGAKERIENHKRVQFNHHPYFPVASQKVNMVGAILRPDLFPSSISPDIAYGESSEKKRVAIDVFPLNMTSPVPLAGFSGTPVQNKQALCGVIIAGDRVDKKQDGTPLSMRAYAAFAPNSLKWVREVLPK